MATLTRSRPSGLSSQEPGRVIQTGESSRRDTAHFKGYEEALSFISNGLSPMARPARHGDQVTRSIAEHRYEEAVVRSVVLPAGEGKHASRRRVEAFLESGSIGGAVSEVKTNRLRVDGTWGAAISPMVNSAIEELLSKGLLYHAAEAIIVFNVPRETVSHMVQIRNFAAQIRD